MAVLNWFLLATVVLYSVAAGYEVLAGAGWKAGLMVAYAVSNYCLLRLS